MEFHELLEKRHSVRSYLPKPIEAEKIEKIIDAAISAPSAGNLQAYKIMVVKDKEKKKALYQVTRNQDMVLHAFVVLVFFADTKRSSSKYGERGALLYSIQDATIAAAYAQLEAENLGLGSVWIGAFEPKKVADILGASEFEIPIAIIPLGYPMEEQPTKRIRRDKKEIVRE